MKDKYLFYIFLVIVFIATCTCCSPSNSRDNGYDETPVTPSALKVTETIESTNVIYPDTKIIKGCVTFSENPISLGGIFVVTNYDTIKNELYDMNSDSVITIGDFGTGHEMSGMFAISPDFQRIAYLDRYNSLVKIINSSGKRLFTRQVPREIEGVISWIGQNGLMLEKNDGYIFRNPFSVFFDIDTGIFREYQSNYPDFVSSDQYYEWGNYEFSHAVFNNDLTRVLYFYVDQNTQGIRLWDLINQKVVAQWSGIYPKAGPPQWFRNGSGFIAGIPTDGSFGDMSIMNIESSLPYKSGEDLYKVSRDGELTRLTYLTIQNTAEEKAVALSPNEQFIAFLLNLKADKSEVGDLSVLDIKSGIIKNYCISDDYGTNVTNIIWSPDSKYLVISMFDEIYPHAIKVILIDLIENTAYSIDKNIMVDGWVTSQ
jgi:hypothetical protein